MKKNGSGAIVGLLMAGGLATRMGECKILLPLSGKSALEQIVTRMRDAGTSQILVVTGGYEERIHKEAIRLKCRPVHNPAFRSGMFSSVLTGVQMLPDAADAFFFLPADTPLIKPSTYRALITAFREGHGSIQVVYPTFQGERAHPPLIGRALAEPILRWSGEGGLRGLLESRPHTSLDVPTADRAATLDMDTPEDYERLKAYAEKEWYPDDEECAELLRINRTPGAVVRHTRRVADTAGLISRALAAKGLLLNDSLLRAACLLHDIAKGQKDHEARGAQWLAERGYKEVAAIVATHKDLPEKNFLGEAEILYLSDKLSDGNVISSLEARMVRMVIHFSQNDEALESARRRIARAMELQKRVENITGRKIDEILRR